jgi:predicted CopG family antitoxin
MQKKLTITIDESVYNQLHSVVGNRKISKFIENLVKPHVINTELALAYQEMATDAKAEQEAYEWTEGLVSDAFN